MLPAHFPETRRLWACVPGWSTSNTCNCSTRSGRRNAKVSIPAPRITYCFTSCCLTADSRMSSRIPGPAEDDGGGATALHPACQSAGPIRTRRRPGRVKSLERRQVALFNNPEFFRGYQMLRQEVIEDLGVVVGGVVSPHKGRSHGGFTHLIGVHYPLPLPAAATLW